MSDEPINNNNKNDYQEKINEIDSFNKEINHLKN
jgi:hypothetical protein